MNRRTLTMLVPTAALALAAGFGVWAATAAPAAEVPKPVPSKTAPAASPPSVRDGQIYQCATCGWLPPTTEAAKPTKP